MLRSRLILLFAALVVVIAGCNSNEPEKQEIPRDLVGNYTFASFRFEPDEPRLADFDMLDTLDQTATNLQIYDSGDFVLSYRFKHGQTRPVTGFVSVDNRRVAFSPTGTMYPDKLTQVLFASPLVLDYSPGDQNPLRATIDMRSNIYEGIPQVDGTLRLSLSKPAR